MVQHGVKAVHLPCTVINRWNMPLLKMERDYSWPALSNRAQTIKLVLAQQLVPFRYLGSFGTMQPTD